MQNYKSTLRSQIGKARWLYILTSILALIVVTVLALYMARVSVVQKSAEWYFKNKNISAQFKIEKLDWNDILITHINLENGIIIPKIHIQRSPDSQQIARISSIVMDVTSIDILTTQKLAALFSQQEDTPPSPLPTFSDLKTHCDQLQHSHVDVRIQNIVHENTSIPLNFQLLHQRQSDATTLTFSGDSLEINKNENLKLDIENYKGDFALNCSKENVSITSKEFALSIKEASLGAPRIMAKKTYLLSSGIDIQITPDNRLTAKIPLQTNVKAHFNEQKLDFHLPRFLVSGVVSLDESQPTHLQLFIDNFSSKTPQSVSLQKLSVTFSKISRDLNTVTGHFDIKNFTFKDEKQTPLIQNVHIASHFEKNKDVISLKANVTDAAKVLSLKNIQVRRQNDNTTLLLDKHQSKIKLNGNIPDLIPMAKEYLKTASGDISLSGQVELQGTTPKGQLRFWTKGIDLSTGFGDIAGMSFDHDVTSLNTFSSSRNRNLKIKSAVVGKAIDNIDLDYHAESKDLILAQKLHLEHEGAQIDATNFEIYPLKKELKNFKSTIKKLKLDHVLAMAVGPFITADGTLSGNLALELQDKIPTVKGNLTSDQESWIHYRKEGDQQQKAITLSDNPMSILNNYLYNFHYKKLDLEITTNRDYQMNVLLAAYGHNPDYLKGKPLKLKINLEQNVLGAIQSMMLSYDLPSKLKEKLEKAGD